MARTYLQDNTNKPRYMLKFIVGIVVLVTSAGGTWLLLKTFIPQNIPTEPVATVSEPEKKKEEKLEQLKLDPARNYGNKYANSILPVGDGKYATDAPEKGTVFVCQQYIQTLIGTQDAETRGSWFTQSKTDYDASKKISVMGDKASLGSFTNEISDGTRNITTNSLPNHNTGTFPVAANDPAYIYAANTTAIKSIQLDYKLTAKPKFDKAKCVGKEVGIMLSGAPLYNAFDVSGRDAGAWEIFDTCGGHPDDSGKYHYHTLSSCIGDVSIKTVIGFALDGFPITGAKIAEDNILTTSDLDECHGITSEIMLDGKMVTSYHYVMTQDFPYSVSCFRAQPTEPTSSAILET